MRVFGELSKRYLHVYGCVNACVCMCVPKKVAASIMAFFISIGVNNLFIHYSVHACMPACACKEGNA